MRWEGGSLFVYFIYSSLIFGACAGLGGVGVTPYLARPGGVMYLPVLRVTGFLLPLSGKGKVGLILKRSVGWEMGGEGGS